MSLQRMHLCRGFMMQPEHVLQDTAAPVGVAQNLSRASCRLCGLTDMLQQRSNLRQRSQVQAQVGPHLTVAAQPAPIS